ncbi:MAG: hypothetical protein ABI668_09185 [Sphingorhabdus sp.]
MNTVLGELNLKFDRDDHVRSCYSLRHTYICLRLLEGADIYQVAKNCRTSAEMIEKYYGRHLQNTINAAAVNVRKPKLLKKTSSRSDGLPLSRLAKNHRPSIGGLGNADVAKSVDATDLDQS